MKGESPDHNQASFLMSGLSEHLNPKHPIYELSKIIDWPSLEEDFTRFYSQPFSNQNATFEKLKLVSQCTHGAL